MKKVLFITNIPAPYRIDFFNALGTVYDLTVIFEARRAEGIQFNWNEDTVRSFRAVFLSDGIIREKRIDFKIFRLLEKNVYDHVVATSYGYFTEMAALFYLMHRQIPYYLELDGGIIREGEAPFKRWMKERIIRSAKGIFSSSAATDRVMRYYGAKQTDIHRYPFTSLSEQDLLSAPIGPEEKMALRNGLSMPENSIVLAVGQFIHRKGFDLLLKAAKKLPQEVGIYLAGALPTEEYAALAAGMGQIHFVGFLDKEALKRYMQASDLFVLPTREDMWGLVINEALANALPVVTTDRCIAGTELIQDGVNGYLIPAEDIDALLDRMNRILQDRDLKCRMGREALLSIRPYTIEGMVQIHQSIFEGVKQ